MGSSRRSPLGLYTMGIAALFLAGFLMMVVFGAQTYRDTAASQAYGNDERAILSYLSTCVKGGDSAGNVKVTSGEYGQVLTVGDGSGYALHIYRYGGELLEEYRALGTTLSPENANVLGKTDIFVIETPVADTLRITTDAGAILLHLRSGVAE